MTHVAVRGSFRLLGSLLVLAAAASAQGQTMSATVRYTDVPQPPVVGAYPGLYAVSIPYVGGIPDGANSGLRQNTCVAAGQQGDGVVNVDDLICAVWGGGDPARRVGGIAFTYFDTQDCLYRSRVATKNGLAGVVFSGQIFTLDRSIGYFLTLGGVMNQPQDFTYTWVDQCEPAFPPVVITPPACSPRMAYLHLPYATDVEDADEVLCGQRGTDWFDVDGDGRPDECPEGLFDGLHSLSVTKFDNATRQWLVRGVTRTALSPTPFFHGPNFALIPGDSPTLSMSSEQLPRTWDPATTCGGSQ